MDHGAWPFFVDGVTCLVKEKKMREDEREKKREKMNEIMKREREREREMKKDFSFEKCLRTLKPAS